MASGQRNLAKQPLVTTYLGPGAEERHRVDSTNDLGRALLRIADEGRVYYILGYVPSDQAKPGSYRRIEVRVRRPGLKVRARPGYVR